MQRDSFGDRLAAAWQQSKSSLCIGLDPEIERFPQSYRAGSSADIYSFLCEVVDATADLVCAYKPQFAHFAARGAEQALQRLIAYIHAAHSSIPVILDAKRGDIGTTAKHYAVEAFERYDADAVTVNPYLGWESIEPFLEYRGRAVAILCRTSNSSSNWLQTIPQHDPVYLRIARHVAEQGNPDLLLVVGATHLEELADVRTIAAETTLLVPGVGAQGGDPAEVSRIGRRADGRGLIVNVSRGVLYPEPGHTSIDALRQAAKRYSIMLTD